MKLAKRCIVCATDFSTNACRAADVASAIALRLRAQLLLVHVADETNAHQDGTEESRSFFLQAKKQLQREAARLRRSGARVEVVLLHGSWAETAIVGFLEKTPASLVIVSSVSKTTFDRWTIGSVSERISQQSPIPTLVVRTPDRLLGWTRQERALKVIVASDFTVSSDAALSWIGQLRKIGECTVTVAHVIWPPDERRRAARATLASPASRRAAVRDLEKKIEEVIDGNIGVHVTSNWGRPDAELVRFTTDEDADLMVVGTHQRHGFGRLAHSSISRGVLRHAPMSVLCVPASVAVTHGVGHRPRIKCVLVATDFSSAGDQAIPWAYASLPAGGIVHMIHVLPPWELPGPLVPHYDPKRNSRAEHKRRMNEARDRLIALVPSAGAAETITTEVEVVADRDPAHAITVAARRLGADLICLASRGRTALAETLLGSVAHAVVSQASQPVLLVRPTRP